MVGLPVRSTSSVRWLAAAGFDIQLALSRRSCERQRIATERLSHIIAGNEIRIPAGSSLAGGWIDGLKSLPRSGTEGTGVLGALRSFTSKVVEILFVRRSHGNGHSFMGIRSGGSSQGQEDLWRPIR